MWRDAGGHSNGDTGGAVDQQVGKGGREHIRLSEGAVEVLREIDSVPVDIIQHVEG